MKIADCLNLMTKSYLCRVVDSVYKENVPKGDEQSLRNQILQNIDSLTSISRIQEVLDFKHMNRTNRILCNIILRTLMEEPEHLTSEKDLHNKVINYEKEIIKKAQDPEAFNYSDDRSIDIYKTVLEVALKDADISGDEFDLLAKLRQKLYINRLEHQLLESQLGMFPSENNKLHSFDDIKQAHTELQKRGILFFCNHAEPESLIVLPEEIFNPVAGVLDFQMSPKAQELMQDKMTGAQLSNANRALGLPVSGTKQERSQRLIETQCKPTEILNTLTSNDLYALCKKLPGVKVSGNKNQLVQNIIDYFASLGFKKPDGSGDVREVYYQYLEELAARNNQELYRLGIIKHDRDMESYFEQGTTYLFAEKLGFPVITMDGNEHADGGVAFPKGGLLLWDNKGKEDVYTFPKSHADQFLRYIRNSVERVKVFLVIAPEIHKDALLQAMHLKSRNSTDTDVALITARDLKYVAEKWASIAKKPVFNPDIFNITGILDRQTLDQRMKLFLS